MSRFEGVCACCDQCGGEIYCGEEYYRINGENVCEDCFVDWRNQQQDAQRGAGG